MANGGFLNQAIISAASYFTIICFILFTSIELWGSIELQSVELLRSIENKSCVSGPPTPYREKAESLIWISVFVSDLD